MFHLAPAGTSKCDHGKSVKQSECGDAVRTLAKIAGKVPARNLLVGRGGRCRDGGWGSVPLGCSAQSGNDWTAHFKSTGSNCPATAYQLVCSGPGRRCSLYSFLQIYSILLRRRRYIKSVRLI